MPPVAWRQGRGQGGRGVGLQQQGRHGRCRWPAEIPRVVCRATNWSCLAHRKCTSSRRAPRPRVPAAAEAPWAPRPPCVAQAGGQRMGRVSRLGKGAVGVTSSTAKLLKQARHAARHVAAAPQQVSCTTCTHVLRGGVAARRRQVCCRRSNAQASPASHGRPSCIARGTSQYWFLGCLQATA